MVGTTSKTWRQARAAASASVGRPLPVEELPVTDIDGRVVARDLVALSQLPPATTSAMDGWAVCGPGPWRLIGDVLAGSLGPGLIADGTAIGVATGSVVPEGADAIVRREDGSVTATADQQLLSADVPPSGRDIRPAGDECVAGELLVAAGSRATPAIQGQLAASGHDRVPVRRQPIAASLVFGDELLTSGLPRDGRIRDSLGPQLPGWLGRMGANTSAPTLVADTAKAHRDAISSALERAEVIVTTGGTARGPVDYLHDAIAANKGELIVDGVAVRPGHPMLLAQFDRADGRRWLVGLPGNPQSAIAALIVLGQPVLSRLLGTSLPRLQSRAGTGLTNRGHHDRLVLGNSCAGLFQPVDYLGSAMLRGLAAATGFASVPPGGVATGEALDWLPLPLG